MRVLFSTFNHRQALNCLQRQFSLSLKVQIGRFFSRRDVRAMRKELSLCTYQPSFACQDQHLSPTRRLSLLFDEWQWDIQLLQQTKQIREASVEIVNELIQECFEFLLPRSARRRRRRRKSDFKDLHIQLCNGLVDQQTRICIYDHRRFFFFSSLC